MAVTRALLLHNPTAGDGRHDGEELSELLRTAGYDVVYQSTKQKPAFIHALQEPSDLLVAAGGDGTVAKVAYHLADRTTPVAMLPLGGANNIARSLGLEGSPADLIRGLRDMRPRRLDVGHAHGPWGSRPIVEGIGLGALTRASAEVRAAKVAPERKREAGREALRRAMAETVMEGFEVCLDGRPVRRDAVIVEIVNIAYSGAALPLAPDADPGDGLLNLIWVGPRERQAMMRWLEDDGHAEPPPAEVHRARRVTLRWAAGAIRLDDDFPEPDASPCRVVAELDGEPLSVLCWPDEPRFARAKERQP